MPVNSLTMYMHRYCVSINNKEFNNFNYKYIIYLWSNNHITKFYRKFFTYIFMLKIYKISERVNNFRNALLELIFQTISVLT